MVFGAGRDLLRPAGVHTAAGPTYWLAIPSRWAADMHARPWAGRPLTDWTIPDLSLLNRERDLRLASSLPSNESESPKLRRWREG